MDSECYAALTGDLIRSTKLSQGKLELARNTLISASEALGGWEGGFLVGGLEFFRGDSWQLLLRHGPKALRAAVYLRASLISSGLSDTRVSIGLGSVEKIEPRISLSTGEAFVLSGRGLDAMPRRARLSIQAPKSFDAPSDWLRVVAALYDALIAKWTARQAEVLRIAIDPREPDQQEIAEILGKGVSRQSVAKTLDRTGWRAIQETLRTFEGARCRRL